MSTRGKKGWILAFSIPCLVLFCLVYAIPFVMVITTSFCDYSLTQSPVFEGLKNFKTIFADPDFSVSIEVGINSVNTSCRIWFRYGTYLT